MEIETLMMPFVRAETERRLNDRLLGCKEKVMDVTGGCNGLIQSNEDIHLIPTLIPSSLHILFHQ